MMGGAFTYFLTCPSSRVWECVSIGKKVESWRALTWQFHHRTQLIDALIESSSPIYLVCLEPLMSNNLYRFGHDRGGLRHIPSLRTNAHMLGREWLAQLSGFECRHPSVCVSESSGFSGSWKMFSWRNFTCFPRFDFCCSPLEDSCNFLYILDTNLTREELG